MPSACCSDDRKCPKSALVPTDFGTVLFAFSGKYIEKNSTAVLGDAAITHIRVFVSAIETTRARSLPGYGRRSDVTAYRDTRLDAVARY